MWCERSLVEHGFTLLEVMIALAVMAVTLLAVVKIQTETLAAVEEARMRMAASWLAQGKMSELEAYGPGNEGMRTGDFEGEAFSRFRWSVHITTSPLVGIVRKATVRVSWRQGEAERYVELTGFF